MSETKSVVRYDYNYLQKYCKENGIELLKDYSTEKVNRDTIIEAKCLIENCNDSCNKDFRNFVKNGSNCKKHSLINRNLKVMQTCLERYGCDHPAKSQQSKEKSKKTCLEKYGCEYSLQAKEVKDKSKQTNLEKYGSENPNQNIEIRKKTKSTCLKKYGCEYALQSKEVKDKSKQTCFTHFGVEHNSQNEEIKKQKIETCLKNFGVEYSQQSKEVNDKSKQTCLYKFGSEYSFQSEKVKDKIKKTNLSKYGVEYPLQNAIIAQKNSSNSYRSKEYKFPSGKTVKIQGYEHFAIDELLQNIDETDIISGATNVPLISYIDKNGKEHTHFVDIFIPFQQKCIEVKSPWTLGKKTDNIFIKQTAGKALGYEYEIWVYNSKGEKVECYK